MRRSLLALALLLLITGSASSQPIARSYPFDIMPLDTASSPFLDALVPPARMLSSADRIRLSADGHLVNAADDRVRLFGTSLLYTSQFLPQDDARMLAVRLRKLGFNAVRLVYNDFFGWDDASFFKTNLDDRSGRRPSSYDVNPLQLARFDTLLYELKRNGIYSVLTLNGSHNYSFGEGVRNWDSTFWGGGLHVFWDGGAQKLQKQWATTLMDHTNPLTGISVKNDPMIAYVAFNYEHSLHYWWQADRLNYINEANKLNQGTSTIAYGESRKLDTLFNQYLQKKYSSQSALVQAWGGDQNVPKKNLISNGSFENFDQEWTFATANGANAGKLISDGGVDSSVFVKLKINSLSSAPVYNDIAFYNLSPRLGKDTLYELTFWAKMGYDPKRAAITARTIGVLVFAYNNNAVGLNANDVIDTSWKKYSFTFRATGSGVHYVYLYFGTDLGDVWLDAFDLHRKAETPLLSHENLASFKIDRLKYSQLPNYPRPRTRDMVMFYDSLERTFYQSMQSHLRGIGYQGLVNWTQTQWYSRLPDIYKASGGDIAEHHTGWDYISARPNTVYSDSTWMVRNTPMVKSRSAGTLANISANLVAGKANILGDYQVPWMNQYHSEHLVLLPALASYQDMDGIFIGPFAIYRDELRASKLPNQFAGEGAFASISKNPAILALLPSASYAFRTGAIQAADAEDTLLHDADDVWLHPLHGSNRGYHGVEGYLDPNAATAFRMRQAFGSKTHKVAAEYPYVSDTSVKKFDDDELLWDQTNGIFQVAAPRVLAGTGFGQSESAQISLERTDQGKDILSYYLLPLDNKPLLNSNASLLTLSTRAQNSGLRWRPDSLSFAKDFGTGSPVLSAATIRLTYFVPVIDDILFSLMIQPLDEHGMPKGEAFTASPQSFGAPIVASIDQAAYATPYYRLQLRSEFSKVEEDSFETLNAILYPNPATDHITISSSTEIHSVDIVNILGQTQNSTSTSGHTATLDLRGLPIGMYTVVINTPKGQRMLPLRKYE